MPQIIYLVMGAVLAILLIASVYLLCTSWYREYQERAYEEGYEWAFNFVADLQSNGESPQIIYDVLRDATLSKEYRKGVDAAIEDYYHGTFGSERTGNVVCRTGCTDLGRNP